MNKRVHIRIRGAVQGVGFRPFVYRLATELGLRGWVINNTEGVIVEAEGDEEQLRQLIIRISRDRPPRSFIQSFEHSYFDPLGEAAFEIRESASHGAGNAVILPDIAVCPECLKELFDPDDRRHRYPFINCTHCGPRYSIIESLPYDRPGTSMKGFSMCGDCAREYADPLDRRFHAQPIACPSCGPHLELWDAEGQTLATHDAALRQAAELIGSGKLVAVKGLGGFHLMAAAENEDAVQMLRARKHREEKPLALMAPDLDAVKRVCGVSPLEERLLLSPESPIVLLRRLTGHDEPATRQHSGSIAPAVAPRNPFLGVMLPYTPLHHLLLKEIGTFVVATSGNLSDEPLCIDEQEALRRLHGIADYFLVHNRPIIRQVDDSIVRLMLGRELLLRRARGYAPLPVPLGDPVRDCLAVGAQLKNTVAFARGTDAFVSQHIGDLETQESFEAFRRTIDSLGSTYRMKPECVGADMHPDYLSTGFARTLGLPIIAVQHHHAHVVSCIAENRLEGRVLGVSWDGTGYGPDGTIWGGEFLLADRQSFERAAALRPFMLPGGESAVKEPRRSMIGILYEIFGDALFDRAHLLLRESFAEDELRVLSTVLRRKLNAPMTSSAGRLFDGVASLIGLRHRMTFEGQAAMELEFEAHRSPVEDLYPFEIRRQSTHGKFEPGLLVDWEPTLRAILADREAGQAAGSIASRFHNTMAEIIVGVTRALHENRVVLTGGCFQNVYLAERAVRRLQAEGFQPYWHQRVPPNDGGIALGQIVAATTTHHSRRTIHSSAKENTL